MIYMKWQVLFLSEKYTKTNKLECQNVVCYSFSWCFIEVFFFTWILYISLFNDNNSRWLFDFFVILRENKAWHFTWIVCLTLFSLKNNSKEKRKRLSSAANLFTTQRVSVIMILQFCVSISFLNEAANMMRHATIKQHFCQQPCPAYTFEAHQHNVDFFFFFFFRMCMTNIEKQS